jgi:CheY-like chemotaxis protein
VAKILVADDNSNVQKTVILALADLGVEVVAVNNGEAAVRKLSDFSPDLILADIFMPVRNGYEVCEYVKKDPRFSRVPVILLVGAFDPLDEREAQRVGADAILKKPFVPPEPLITMVKTLLERSLGERLVTVPPSAPAIAVQVRAARPPIAEVAAPAPGIPEESTSQEFPSPSERVKFGEGDHPVAFGTLLETAARGVAAPKAVAIEPVEDEQILTSTRDATLGDPIFWKNDSPPPELEEVPVTESSSVEASSFPEARSWKDADEEVSPPIREQDVLVQPAEPLEFVREELEETATSVVDPVSILQDPAALATLNVESHKPDDLAANPIEWMSTAPPERSYVAIEVSPEQNEPATEASGTVESVDSSDHALDLVAELAKNKEQVSAPLAVPVLVQAGVSAAEKIPVSASPAPATPEPAAFIPPATKIDASLAAQRAIDTARSIPKRDWADLSASLRPSAIKLVAQEIKSETATSTRIPVAPAGNSQAALAGPAADPVPDTALIEAVVQRVLDKMRPQVVDIITKEFLRPIVQTLVHREIEKK